MTFVLARPHDDGRRRSPKRKDVNSVTFTPTIKRPDGLPEKVEDFLATCNRRQRRAFTAEAKRENRAAAKEKAQAEAELARLLEKGPDP